MSCSREIIRTASLGALNYACVRIRIGIGVGPFGTDVVTPRLSTTREHSRCGCIFTVAIAAVMRDSSPG
jgi:hypothetical protein